jgi:hypothetical protein
MIADAALPALVAQYFPPTGVTVSDDWTSEPSDEWDGPEDDDILMERMLNSRGSVGSMLGGKATVQALWHGDATALAAAYPSATGKPFDHSSADAALCQHLAFWTGKNCERIDRLFRRSDLMRDKWDRPDYNQATVLHAVSHCRNVYSGGRPAETPGETSESEGLRTGWQFMPVSDQPDHFKGCVYIRDSHRVFTPDGALLRSEQFRATYGGYVFALDAVSQATSKNAWEVFTESQAFNFPKAEGICFRPERESGALILEEGRTLLNTYVPIETPRQAGDPEPFLKHLRLVLPNQCDRDILMAYMAACVQYKGVKFQWCPLIQGTEGNGKTLFITAIAQAVGNRYTHLPNASDLGGNGQKFNMWIQGNLFIGVEEIYVSDRREVSEALKTLITNSRIEIQGKGMDQVTGDNRANFLMCSNHKEGMTVTIDSRRYCILYSAQQTREDKKRDGMTGDYFPKLYAWLRAEGYAIVTDYLYSYAIPDELNPAIGCPEAPESSSTAEAINITRGYIEQELIEAIEEELQGFRGGWISSKAFDNLLEQKGYARRINRNKRPELIKSLGYVPHPALSKGRVNSIIAQEGGRPCVYIKEGVIHHNELTKPLDVLNKYCAAQGYIDGVKSSVAEGAMGGGG